MQSLASVCYLLFPEVFKLRHGRPLNQLDLFHRGAAKKYFILKLECVEQIQIAIMLPGGIA